MDSTFAVMILEGVLWLFQDPDHDAHLRLEYRLVRLSYPR